jgi:hypothetical protein
VDEHVVAAGRVLGRRRRGHDPDERLVRIRGRVEPVEFGLGDRPRRSNVARREDAPRHRDEMGEEVDADRARVRARVEALASRGERQLLFDLGDVAVPAEAVRADALVDLAEQHLGLEVPTRARHAALGVHDEVADEPGARQRGERKERGRRIAAGRPDDGDRRIDESGQLLAMELRQPVDRLVQEVGTRVLEAVPARVVGWVAQAEVGSEVDDRRAGRDDVRHEGCRRAMGKGEEGGVDVGEHRADGEVRRRQMRMVAGDRVVVSVAPGEPDDLDVRVAGKEPDELGPDVAGRPDDPDADAPRPAVRLSAARRPWYEPRRAVRRGRRGRPEPRAHGRTGPLAGGRLGWLAGTGRTVVMGA